MNQYFPPDRSHGSDLKVELDWSNYATKTDLKNVTHVDVSSFAIKTNLASLKTEVDKFDIGKLVPIPNDLAKLSNVVKIEVVKKTEYNSLKTKINDIDTTDFVKKTKYEKDGSDKIIKIDKKVSDVSDFIKKTDFNAKVTEIVGKIPSISGLATNSELTAVENKILDVSGLVKQTNLDTELKKISDRFASNKSRHLQIGNELKKLQKFDAAYFRGKNYFDGNDGAQNTLVFQTTQKHFKLSNKNQTDEWKSKGLSNRYLSVVGTLGSMVLSKPIKPMHVIFKRKGTLVQNDNYIIAGGPVVNICFVYNISPKTINSNFVFRDCLFGAIKITNTTNSDTDKWQYSGYGVGFENGVGSKNSELIKYPMCLDLSKDYNTNAQHKKTAGLFGNIYDFSVSYDATAVDNILHIHKYLMRKNGLV